MTRTPGRSAAFPLVLAAGMSVAAVVLTGARPAPAPAGAALAVEDTLRTEVPEVLVRAPRVTLDELLDRVVRGEAARESLLSDQQFTAVLRVLSEPRGAAAARLREESVWRVYRARPDKVRAIQLRRVLGPGVKDDDETTEADFSPGMGERMVNFAFRPENRREYRFHIVGRDILADHVVYRIAFDPLSPLQPLPSGVVWVDTRDNVIVRQEIGFSRSPVPLLIRRLDRMVVERERVDGHWVMTRVLMRAEFTMPMPRLGRALEIAMLFRDYRINRGVDPAVFGDGGASR